MFSVLEFLKIPSLTKIQHWPPLILYSHYNSELIHPIHLVSYQEHSDSKVKKSCDVCMVSVCFIWKNKQQTSK